MFTCQVQDVCTSSLRFLDSTKHSTNWYRYSISMQPKIYLYVNIFDKPYVYTSSLRCLQIKSEIFAHQKSTVIRVSIKMLLLILQLLIILYFQICHPYSFKLGMWHILIAAEETRDYVIFISLFVLPTPYIHSCDIKERKESGTKSIG